jgi:hypothetical protein
VAFVSVRSPADTVVLRHLAAWRLPECHPERPWRRWRTRYPVRPAKEMQERAVRRAEPAARPLNAITPRRLQPSAPGVLAPRANLSASLSVFDAFR